MSSELQHRPLLPTLSPSTAPDLYSFASVREILQGAVHHLCVTIKNKFALNILERVENTLNNAIQQGYIEDFSDLTRFINEEDFAQVFVQRPSCSSAHLTNLQTFGEPSIAIDIRHSLLAACSIWKPSYDLQQRYHILQTYLGLKEHDSIVPHAMHLTTPAEEPHNVRDSSSRLNSQVPSTTFSSALSQSLESNSQAATAASTNDIEMGMQPFSGHDVSQPSYGNPRRTLDDTPPPHQQPPVQRTRDPSDLPRAKTYCQECKHDFRKVLNYNKHRNDIHVKVRFQCRHPPCGKTFSRKHYRDRHEKEKHATGPA